jgi:large conductance mechanosensitive channel
MGAVPLRQNVAAANLETTDRHFNKLFYPHNTHWPEMLSFRPGCFSLLQAKQWRNAMLREFRDFVARGNVLDLAVAVIIGAAFATITASLTDDIIMPVVGAVFGGLDFANYFTVLGPIPESFTGDASSYAALKAAGVAVLGWGQFVTVLINFLILALVIFLIVRYATKIMRRSEEAAGPSEVDLLTEIRDELRKRG